MTKEELEKEVDDWCFRKKYTHGYSYIYAQVRNAYICGAEPREKRIEELEAQIEKMKCCENCRYCNEWGEANSNSPNCKKCNWVSNWQLRR